MPIGWDDGDAGGYGPAPTPAPVATADPLDPWAHGDDGTPDGGQWSEPVAEEQGYWAWVEWEEETVYEVQFFAWQVAFDGRLCPECFSRNGDEWEAGEGVYPPLHPNCRCQRVYSRSEWRTRFETVGEWRWVPS